MDTLDKLAETMERMSRVALAKFRPGDSMPIQHERLQLLAWLGGEVDPADLAGDRILSALQQYDKAGFVRDLRQARLLCYGCTQAYREQGERLLESRDQLERLLQYITQHSHTRAFRKCYRGLLNAYFAYDPDAASVKGNGRSNWSILRDFLLRLRPALTATGYVPQWVLTLNTHNQLLTDDPCAPYRDAPNSAERFEAARLEMNINADSWLVRRFVQSQIAHILNQNDSEFQRRVDEALLLLDQYPLYVTQMLGQLLDRYSRCAARPPSETLRHFAVAQWGVPWLPQNAVNWQCSPAALSMIASWAKQDLVREFFHLFAPTGADNSRRAAFWNLYSEDLQGMYFALGSDAFDIKNKAFLQFRDDAKGLVVKLNDSKHNLHAVILQFATHHVVEFSQQMNVAYFYDARQGTPQFYLSKGWVDVGALSVGTALKENAKSPPAKPMPHNDDKLSTWEGRFAQELGGSEMARQHFCQHHAAQYSVNAGNAWVKPDSGEKYPPEITSVLLGWGYTWSPDTRGYFRKITA